MNIKIGDIVKVKDVGAEYTTYADFFSYNGVGIMECSDVSLLKDIARYRLYSEELDGCEEYEVLFVGKHHADKLEEIAFIKPINSSRYSTYLISTSGLSLSKKKMTYSELRDIVGFDFELVD